MNKTQITKEDWDILVTAVSTGQTAMVIANFPEVTVLEFNEHLGKAQKLLIERGWIGLREAVENVKKN